MLYLQKTFGQNSLRK